MASGGHILAQQRPNVEARIKVLINDDLKKICKAYSQPVSGTKIVLQKRCIAGECHHTIRVGGSGAERDVGKDEVLLANYLLAYLHLHFPRLGRLQTQERELTIRSARGNNS